MTDNESFAKSLVYYRSKADLTQEELAKKSGISKVQIARYETGNASPRPNAIMKLAKALNISTEDLGYKNLPASTMPGAQIEARVLLGIMNLKDDYLNVIIMQRNDKETFEDMIIELKSGVDKNVFLEKIEQIAKNNNVIISLNELSSCRYALSLKFRHLNLTKN